MKKFFLIIMALFILMSCATTNYISRRNVNEMDEISYILANYYPQLHNYFMEGVLDVDYIKEVTLEDGNVDYKVKYHFIRYYYTNYSDRMDALKVHFPEIYQMYVSGVIEINSLYKYVEKETGIIRHHVSYSRIYDYYYHYYPRIGGAHIYYRPRPIPPRPAPPVVRPNPPKQSPTPRKDNPRPNVGNGRRR